VELDCSAMRATSRGWRNNRKEQRRGRSPAARAKSIRMEFASRPRSKIESNAFGGPRSFSPFAAPAQSHWLHVAAVDVDVERIAAGAFSPFKAGRYSCSPALPAPQARLCRAVRSTQLRRQLLSWQSAQQSLSTLDTFRAPAKSGKFPRFPSFSRPK
jgi:hypothetical protein